MSGKELLESASPKCPQEYQN